MTRPPATRFVCAATLALLAWLLAVAPGPAWAQERASYAGKLLVAAPSMPDPRFARTVILMIQHSDRGALGFVVNRVAGRRAIARVLGAIGKSTAGVTGELDVHWGGPVQLDTAFVIHTGNYSGPSTRRAPGGYAMTADPKILQDIGRGKGPKRYFLAVGYAGWGPGQLEREIGTKHWVVIPADRSLVFSADPAGVWKKAYQRRGIDL